MSTEGISALERGYRRNPQRETLALLANALALDANQRDAFEAAAGTGSVTAGAWTGAWAGNLPLQLSTFVGRKRELGEISELMRDQRLVTITGTGGVGKTQTALRVARALSEGLDIAAYFAPLAPVGDPALVLTAIASALSVQEPANRSLLEALVARLKNRSALLVLDNCEHVVAAVASAARALLDGCPHVRILATSREPLAAAGECRYRLPSMRADEAMALFVDRAQAVDFHFKLTHESAHFAAEICQRLDGIPLAIELAAARINVLPLRAVSEKLDDRFRILTSGRRTALPRQQTMRAAIDWSYELLPAPERRVFERLSVFVGGANLDAATKVCAGPDVEASAVVNVLVSLVDKSLVTAELAGESQRFGQLESILQYGREKLVESGEYQATALAHASACLELVENLNTLRERMPKRLHNALTRPEHDNWRAAVRWTLEERQDVATGQRLVGAIGSGWVPLSASERAGWVQAAQNTSDDATPMAICAHLDLAEAYVEWFDSRYKASLEAAQRALARFRQLEDSLSAARAQLVARNALTVLQRAPEAEAALQSALAVFREYRATRSISDALRLLAILRHRTGDFAQARAFYAESATTLSSIEGEYAGSAHLPMLAELEFQAGNAREALRVGVEAIAIYRGLNDRFYLLQSLCNAAAYAIALEQYEVGLSYAREALVLAADDEISFSVALALQHLVAAVALQSDKHAKGSADDRKRAPRILGFVDARLEKFEYSRECTEQQEYDRVTSSLRAEFGRAELARLMTEGRSWTQERAVAEGRAI